MKDQYFDEQWPRRDNMKGLQYFKEFEFKKSKLKQWTKEKLAKVIEEINCINWKKPEDNLQEFELDIFRVFV